MQTTATVQRAADRYTDARWIEQEMAEERAEELESEAERIAKEALSDGARLVGMEATGDLMLHETEFWNPNYGRYMTLTEYFLRKLAIRISTRSSTSTDTVAAEIIKAFAKRPDIIEQARDNLSPVDFDDEQEAA